MGLFGTLKRKAEDKAMSIIVAKAVKMLAEGRFGAGPAKLYWALAGKKSWIAAILATLAAAVWGADQAGLCALLAEHAVNCGAVTQVLGTAAAALAALGLYDGALRLPAPEKPTR